MSTKDKRGCNRGCNILGCLFCTILMAALLVIFALDQFQSMKAAAPFAAMNDRAKAACAQCIKPSEVITPYYRGKVLAVDAQTGVARGQIIKHLPSDIAAVGPDEVTTIFCIGPVVKKKTGSYQGGSPAYTKYRDVCIFDLTENKTVFFTTISGGPPPLVKTTGGSDSGADPEMQAIPDFIQSLTPK